MASRQSTANTHARRNGPPFRAGKGIVEGRSRPRPPAKHKIPVSAGTSADQSQTSRALEAVLKHERGCLADAQSVLGCLHVALLYAEDGAIKEDPGYANAAAIALALVREAANRLDSACVRPLVDALGSARPAVRTHVRQRR